MVVRACYPRQLIFIAGREDCAELRNIPDNIIDRVGEHAEAAWKSVNRMPLFANLSIFGVSISLPYAPISEYPISSARMMRKFGREGCRIAWVIVSIRND